ncbi:chloride channel protein [Gloeocapsa sp. PCC 73106]|uniref:chloride channel protein n=1 Tax=Gloeocapsa sp. PCC 73106 TaxID=102232 RepID=UPI0002AC548C|nr:chloride channel protein [Gloeocapsa sp. PCC 73106]ELR98544.1 chloride channel protein EriC [Gloeocapsa sp. PCC 73106]
MSTKVPESPHLLVASATKSFSLSYRLTQLLNQLQPSPEIIFFISAFAIGGASGLALVLFYLGIEFFENLAFNVLMSQISAWGYWTLALIPVLGSMLVGLLYYFYPNFSNYNCLQDQSVVKVSPKLFLIKCLGAAISLGTGASLGPEGPSVEIGGNMGLLLAQLLRVSQKRSRLLMSAGAAAGFAAGFNAPIAGVFFTLERVLGTTFTTPAASIILLAAVVAATIARVVFGIHPAFELPTYLVVNQWEFLLYIGLGVLAGFISLAYTQGIKFAQRSFQKLEVIPRGFKPILGGLTMGLVGLALPQILGIGYGTLEVILSGKIFSIPFLSMILVIKLVVTAICLGSGLVGGIFAPALFLGACLGAVYGQVLVAILPPEVGLIAPPAAYAMVGMAALLAGSVKAPLTAIILLFELTQNYLIILPLMAAVGVSVWIVSLVEAQPMVQTLNFKEMGINLTQQDELEILKGVSVARIMDVDYFHLCDQMSVLKSSQLMISAKCHTALVVDEQGQLSGIITLGDLRHAIRDNSDEIEGLSIGDISTKEILYAYPDESVTEVLKRMLARDIFLLPVVSPDNSREVLGVIDKPLISLASDLTLTERAIASAD